MDEQGLPVVPAEKVYQTIGGGPDLLKLGDVAHGAWRIGPRNHWKVGDELRIPDRPPRFGLNRPGCERARVTVVHDDGVATCQDVKLIEARRA